jgi:ABC-type transport system involved in multi-copper enzyme maturation permease subunit
VAEGAIDLTLARPISRLKLYALKILGALLFMLLQVTISVLIAWLLMGLRFGIWFHGALWAIPLLTLQFLYVYAVCALVGLWTRSPLASLLITLVFWGVVSLVQFTSNQVDSNIAESRTFLARFETREADMQERAAAEDRDLTRLEQRRLDTWTRQADMRRQTLEFLEPWQGAIHTIELCVPKTGDVQKIIAEQIDAPTFQELIFILGGFDPDDLAAAGINDPDTAQDLQESGVAGARAVRDVDTAISLLTSLISTGLLLGLGTFIFARRDF